MATAKVPNRTHYDDVAFALADLRRVNLYGEVGREQHAHIENMITYLQSKSKKAIDLRMNTPGGTVVDGLAIYDSILRNRLKTPINITVQGACMSMGVVILQAGTQRLATPNSQFLLHEVSYGSHNSLSGQEDDFLQAAKLQQKLNAIIVGRSGIGEEELKKLIKRRDYAVSAQEALEHNLIDAII